MSRPTNRATSNSRKSTGRSGSTRSSPADGWTAKVTKDNGSRAIVRFTNDTTGERVVVIELAHKKGKLKTRIK